MTNQEFFTKSVTHVLGQTSRSVGPTGQCLYAAHDGNACAIGCVLPFELALKAGDADVDCLFRDFPEAREILGDVARSLLCYCQAIHDDEPLRNPRAKARLKFLFKEVAEEFGLVMP